MPFAGWPYAAILQRMKDEPTVKPLRLGEIVVEEFMRSFRSNNVALSILRPSKAAVLPDLIGPLAEALRAALSSPKTSELVAGAFLDSAHGDVRPLIDLYDLCENLDNLADLKDTMVGKQARKVRDLLKEGRNGLIVSHKKDSDFEGLNGLGI